jgi:hypothetical protein
LDKVWFDALSLPLPSSGLDLTANMPASHCRTRYQMI